MGAYRMMFIFLPDLGEEAREKVVSGISEEISKLNGKVLRTEYLGRRTFARPLKNQEEGHYVRLYVELGPEAMDTLLARFKLNPDIFRVQIIRTLEGSGFPSEKTESVEPREHLADKNPAEVDLDG